MKYLGFIVLICIAHILVVHGSPLLKIRCTPGGGKGDCDLGQQCETEGDCTSDNFCIDGECRYNPPPYC
ncbi:4202_t:CDS:2, partial [Scutellospora calospora]